MRWGEVGARRWRPCPAPPPANASTAPPSLSRVEAPPPAHLEEQVGAGGGLAGGGADVVVLVLVLVDWGREKTDRLRVWMGVQRAPAPPSLPCAPTPPCQMVGLTIVVDDVATAAHQAASCRRWEEGLGRGAVERPAALGVRGRCRGTWQDGQQLWRLRGALTRLLVRPAGGEGRLVDQSLLTGLLCRKAWTVQLSPRPQPRESAARAAPEAQQRRGCEGRAGSPGEAHLGAPRTAAAAAARAASSRRDLLLLIVGGLVRGRVGTGRLEGSVGMAGSVGLRGLPSVLSQRAARTRRQPQKIQASSALLSSAEKS